MKNPASYDYQNTKLYKSERRFKHISFIVAIVLIIVLSFLLYYKHTEDSTINEYNNYDITKTNSLANTFKPVSSPKYVIDSTGHMDKVAAKAIPKLENIMAQVTTYSNASQYNRNYKFAHNYIQDPEFYKLFLKRDIDSSGNSAIKALDIKSKYKNSTAYEIYPGRYLVIVNYYLYHDPRDLSHLDSLTPSQKGFIVTGNQFHFNHVQPIKGLSLVDD